MRQYYIISNENGKEFYPMVAYRKFFRIRRRRIGIHPQGFGLYDTLSYPLPTPEQAAEVIRNYKTWEAQQMMFWILGFMGNI